MALRYDIGFAGGEQGRHFVGDRVAGARAREDRDPEHRLAFGGELSLAELMSQRPRADERGEGWADTEPTRFGRYALRLWDGLLAVEEFSDR